MTFLKLYNALYCCYDNEIRRGSFHLTTISEGELLRDFATFISTQLYAHPN